MSYEVTATRRRPQKFDDLVGQEFVAETLKNSIKSGKIAHAYLFSGPRGCGKTSTARILAKALNCQNGPADNPCGVCSNCVEITKGASLDVIEIDGASNTSVENIRQIKDEVQFPPNSCRYKIYIIDEVHMLSNSAFNALLKTIEEPPEYVIFIFATTELQKVPATIKSRCQQFNFRLVSIDKVKECLAQAAAEINVQAEDEALFWIARESTGSMRDAYTLFDQVVAFSDGHITYEKIRDKLGLVGIDRLNTVFEACAQEKTEEVVNILDDFLQCGVSIEQLISNSADYLRSLLLIKSGISKESLLGNSVERYSKLVLQAWNSIQIERALSIFLQLYRDIRYSLSPRYELELAFSRMCWIGQYVSNVEVKKAIDAAQNLLAGGVQGGAGAVRNAPGGVSGGAPVAAAPVQNVGNLQVSDAAGGNSMSAPVTEVQQGSLSSPVNNEHAVPEGLPRLSMLDSIDSMDDDIPEEVSQNPFYDGGPLPPEQSVEQNQAAETPKQIDPRIKLNIAEQVQENENSAPSVYIPQETQFSANPDDEDDGWTNTDEPPSDDYYVDEQAFAEQAEQAYEESVVMEQNPSSPSNTPVQLNDMVTLANGQSVSIAQIRGSLTAALAVNDSFTASLLEKTGEWKVQNDTVCTTVFSSYDLTLLNKKLPELSAELSKTFGKPVSFSVILQEKKVDEKKPEELPEQVQVLLNTFKGTVVGR